MIKFRALHCSERESTKNKMSLVELGKRLLDAAKRGDTDEVRSLMSNGAPFTTDWLGMSPLHFAARNGHFQTAEVLLRAGISRDARTKVDRTPLHVASQEGHVTIVDLLLANSADIEAKDMLKMTPLHWATEKGHLPVVELLIKNGADINVDDKFERSTIEIAQGNERTDILQLLQLGMNNPDLTGLTEGETVTIETTESLTPTVNASVIEEIPPSNVVTTVASTPVANAIKKESTSHVLPVTIVPNSTSPQKSDNSDQNSTSVLATLAVLAEATAPFNAQNPSTAEAVSWLESHGITMISTNDAGIITSAVESGQSIALTEAGKMALNIIKQQGLTRTTDDEAAESVVGGTIETVVGDTEQKVITIVTTDQTEVGNGEEPVLVTVNADGSTDGTLTVEATEEPPTKKCRIEEAEVEEASAVPITQLLETKPSKEDQEQEDLRRQLEEMKRQAEAFKQQLLQKEQEAEVYKKQLSEMVTAKGDMNLNNNSNLNIGSIETDNNEEVTITDALHANDIVTETVTVTEEVLDVNDVSTEK